MEIYYVHEMNSPMHLGLCTFCTINFSGAINIMQKVVILQVLDLGKRAGGRLTVSTRGHTQTMWTAMGGGGVSEMSTLLIKPI